jgi:hypothetical protein
MAHPDLEELLNALVPFGQEMLSKHGEFFPFGATMSIDGEIIAEAAYDGDEQPPSEQLIELLTQTFRQKAASGQIRAAGICCDVRTIPPGQKDKTDAVCLKLEHQSGEAANLYLPYKKRLFGGYKYGEIFGVARTPEFFVPDGRAA